MQKLVAIRLEDAKAAHELAQRLDQLRKQGDIRATVTGNAVALHWSNPLAAVLVGGVNALLNKISQLVGPLRDDNSASTCTES